MNEKRCRLCASPLTTSFCDLGVTPLSNAYLSAEDLERPETFFPLHAFVCNDCFLVQLEEFEAPDRIFTDYAYFSSYSSSWLDHSRRFAEHAIERFGLNRDSQVVELASNDGYLLQYFLAAGIPVLGIEPAANVAEAARAKGIDTRAVFFGSETAGQLVEEGLQADLLVGNNVLAHVPDANDFVQGMRRLLKPGGVISLEFPHLKRLIEGKQFDTVYHEHFSYFSLRTAMALLRRHGLRVFDVKELGTHGGSLRMSACHEQADIEQTEAVNEVLDDEARAGLTAIDTYERFERGVRQLKFELLTTLIGLNAKGNTVAAYGAPAKGNTLLNYCGIRGDLVAFTVDASPHKQNKYLPGSRIPVYKLPMLVERRPDYILILPWNLEREIVDSLQAINTWGARYIVPVPAVRFVEP